MRVLVAASDYPNINGHKGMMYIHTRNLYYLKEGIEVFVLNFCAKENYIIEGISVITLNSYITNIEKTKYDILILHAPNIRNHYLFLKRFGNRFPKNIFFFHGHEVFDIYKEYPKPYDFRKKTLIRILVERLYNKYKLMVWKKYFPQIAYKSKFIFVSNSLESWFYKYINLNSKEFRKNSYIINNSIGEVFEKNNYCIKEDYDYDFITIRANLDSSKYAIDLVTEIARTNPQYKFLVIGKGDYYKINQRPENITLINQAFSQNELLQYIDQAKCALMLTRHDTQGVMSCELASYGIPLITSDIQICHEIFDVYNNVVYINNQNVVQEFSDIMKKGIDIGNKKFYLADQTVKKEVELIKSCTLENI